MVMNMAKIASMAEPAAGPKPLGDHSDGLEMPDHRQFDRGGQDAERGAGAGAQTEENDRRLSVQQNRNRRQHRSWACS